MIDGGVLNPVPIAPTFSDGTDITIAVNLAGEPVITDEAGTQEDSGDTGDDSSLRARINGFIDNLKQSMQKDDHFDWGAYDIVYEAFEAMQTSITRQKLAAYPPDIVIEIPRNVCRTLEFNRAAELIALGYQQAGERLS
jgi:NTE family protein